jgi:NAD(P)H-dependent FMN reductase
MITVISGTACNDSKTLRLATIYAEKLRAVQAEPVELLSLLGLPVWERGEELKRVERELLIPTRRFVFIMPEYNGSFPGMLKLLLDNSDIKACWWGKKALLTGLADGRAGNFRGLEHMTGILQYLHMDVYWDKIPLSRINEELDAHGGLSRPVTEAAVDAQIRGFLEW